MPSVFRIISPTIKREPPLRYPDAGGKSGGPTLELGFQTRPENIETAIHRKAQAWSPSWAQSYRIETIRHTDVIGFIPGQPTGWGSFTVRYFTRTEPTER